MVTVIDKLFKGLSVKEIEEILFNKPVGVKEINKKLPLAHNSIYKYKVKEPVAN